VGCLRRKGHSWIASGPAVAEGTAQVVDGTRVVVSAKGASVAAVGSVGVPVPVVGSLEPVHHEGHVHLDPARYQQNLG
jgi:hypothetical protein